MPKLATERTTTNDTSFFPNPAQRNDPGEEAARGATERGHAAAREQGG